MYRKSAGTDTESRRRNLRDQWVEKGAAPLIENRVYGLVQLADISPDGTRLATFGGDSVLRIWDLETGQTVQTIEAAGTRITGLCWSSNPVLLFTVSAGGRIRAWGTPGQKETLQILQPLREPAGVAMATGADNPPATMCQLYEMIDLPAFPRLPNAAVESDIPYRVEYRVGAATDEIRTFYHHYLGQAGWKPVHDSAMRRGDYTEFEKNGFRVSLSLNGPQPTKVVLQFLGNADSRKLPRQTDATDVSEAFNSTSYRTSEGIVELEVFLLKEFHAAGWTPYTRINSSSRWTCHHQSISASAVQ
jgi:WD40 domain-containing protein